jgi:uncharacterized protein YdeI (YjbR/CyaY-like superfamily)
MRITRTFQPHSRSSWRQWLQRNHARAKEIWLVSPGAASGRKRIPYNDVVEEALCFGWIDSIIKKFDVHHSAQRFTPRKSTTQWSQHNIERMRRLIKQKLMTPAGLAVYRHATNIHRDEKLVVAPDILAALRTDRHIWKNFRAFPASYQRIRIAYLEHMRTRGPEHFQRSLKFFIAKTRVNKRFGFGLAE